MNRSLEENEGKAGYGESETAESTKHDELTEALHAESAHSIGDAGEALPVESTRNMISNETKTQDEIDAVFSKVSDSSAKSAAQAVESDGSNEREVGNEHH